ncbi:unnamed protein product [Ophioblennius macclurei]
MTNLSLPPSRGFMFGVRSSEEHLPSSGAMKTVCLSLLLLLLSACCSHALNYGSRISTAPGNCCFEFSDKVLPLKVVANVKKTHRSCRNAGFILTTKRKRQICYKQSFQWAVDAYNRPSMAPEGSAQ